uniref:CCHC-type domain-containing protein n=1 Tax=Lepeophtheirus salmonis TaxID=72036 RepID=A0A0K2VD29_LEPSM
MSSIYIEEVKAVGDHGTRAKKDCGFQFSYKNGKVCLLKSVECTRCGKRGHYVRVCRCLKENSIQKFELNKLPIDVFMEITSKI